MTAAHTSESRLAGRLIANENTHNVVDFATARDSGKGLALLKARFERAGHQVHDGGNNDFIVVKADWCMSRHCPDLAALRMFARVLGVSA